MIFRASHLALDARFFNGAKKEIEMLKKLNGKVVSVACGAFVLPGAVFAAVPENVSTGLTTAATDAGAVAGLALLIVIGIAAFKYMRRGV